MAYNKSLQNYECDVCGEEVEEATYSILIKQGKKTYITCDPVAQAESGTFNSMGEFCLLKFMRYKKFKEVLKKNCKVRRVFWYGD